MRPALAILLLAALCAPGALAHGGGAALPGDTLERATVLGAPPARVFERIEAGESHYHAFTPTDGTRLRLYAPAGAAPEGLVLVILFGPDLPRDTPVPADVERPPEMGALVYPASGREERVDPRVPARRLLLLERELALPRSEHVLVVRAESDARVAIFLENDERWPDVVLMPAHRRDERDWAGGPAALAQAAGALGAALAAPLVWRWRRRAWPLLRILAVASAALFLASTAVLLADAWRAQVVPWMPLLGGASASLAAIVAAGDRGREATRRGALLLASALALVAFAGFLWGPIAALAGALLPEPTAPREG